MVDNYDDVSVYEPAKDLLAYLGEQDKDLLAEDQKKEPTKGRAQILGGKITEETKSFVSKYKFKPESIHFFIFVVNTDEIEIRQLRSEINDFNRETYPDRNLTLSNVYLEDKKQILTVTNFENKKKADDYFEKINKSNNLNNYNQRDLLPFIISLENYPVFYRDRDLKGYLEFFEYYYN